MQLRTVLLIGLLESLSLECTTKQTLHETRRKHTKPRQLPPPHAPSLLITTPPKTETKEAKPFWKADSILRAHHLKKGERPPLKGTFQKWPAPVPARHVLSSTPQKSLQFSVSFQYDEEAIYLASSVKDKEFLNTSPILFREGYLSLLLTFPLAEKTLALYELPLKVSPATSTKNSTSSIQKSPTIQGMELFSFPNPEGYTLHAVIPWSNFPEATLTRVGLKAAIRYQAINHEGTTFLLLATADGDEHSPESLPPFLLESEQIVFDQLLIPRGFVHQTPRYDLLVDISGDPLKEKISVFNNILVIYGPHFQRGLQFFSRELEGELIRCEARNVTRQQKGDLVLYLRLKKEDRIHEWVEILSFLQEAIPTTSFAHDVAIIQGNRRLSNAIRISQGEIEVSSEPSIEWSASADRTIPLFYHVSPLLLPWGEIQSQKFYFNGTSFIPSSRPSSNQKNRPSTHPLSQKRK
ncbi:hypothetical protein [Pajaroellobacter abortibovis]|uniref:Uncharacterized protein n=1 Tax=Pajaroellobacter abortibovis TaxID=1882918 RepID=A0A1L6MVD1_9BACT|nr:hypothetical protein [Pajaroellobacter abortibovis]APR99479.1 hypothetical protein BCY86_01375 [Pajaroellobacter abortibovis]